MKKIVSIISIIGCIIFSAGFTSCEDMMGDFLDKAASNDVTEDTIFSSRQEVEYLVASIYKYGVHSNLAYAGSDLQNPESTMWTGTSDESESTTNWYFPQRWNQGQVTATMAGVDRDGRFDTRFKALRLISILLDRIDDVPDANTDHWKERLSSEAKIVRAMNYFEMLKRYGGMPIIDTRLDPAQDLDLTRRSLKEVVDFIVKDCDEAIADPYLPDYYQGSIDSELANKGRASKMLAHAIKSKTLLFAASPLFNTATPYMDFGEYNNIICYGDQDNNRWLLAAEAARDALLLAQNSGNVLLGSYLDTWNVYDNNEIIFAEKAHYRIGQWEWPWGEFSRYSPPNQGYGGTTPTLNFVKKYEMSDGTQARWLDGGGDDAQEKMESLDKRFSQTIFFNMQDWSESKQQRPLFQEAIATMELGSGGIEGCISKAFGGFWLHKGMPYAFNGDPVWAYVPNSTLYQLNEIYLNYAEALFEYNANGGNDDAAADNIPAGFTLSARQAINTIRDRADQPAVETGHSFYADFRELIRNERAIELAFDNHRFWDIRRWMIAEQEGVMQGDMWGIKINLIDPSPENIARPPLHSGYRYTPYVFETRTFYRRMYLHPIGINDANRGLLQNPGY